MDWKLHMYTMYNQKESCTENVNKIGMFLQQRCVQYNQATYIIWTTLHETQAHIAIADKKGQAHRREPFTVFLLLWIHYSLHSLVFWWPWEVVSVAVLGFSSTHGFPSFSSPSSSGLGNSAKTLLVFLNKEQRILFSHNAYNAVIEPCTLNEKFHTLHFLARHVGILFPLTCSCIELW